MAARKICFVRSIAVSVRGRNFSRICKSEIALFKISCFDPTAVSKPEHIAIDRVYVPAIRRRTLDAEAVKRIAESILEVGQETPILVRPDEDQHRYVLLDGLHRLEACKALGETTISALVGSAGDPADEKPTYEVAAELQRQTMERLKKLRLEQEAAQKTEAVMQPLVQGSRLDEYGSWSEYIAAALKLADSSPSVRSSTEDLVGMD